jgi:hypothetical protein
VGDEYFLIGVAREQSVHDIEGGAREPAGVLESLA